MKKMCLEVDLQGRGSGEADESRKDLELIESQGGCRNLPLGLVDNHMAERSDAELTRLKRKRQDYLALRAVALYTALLPKLLGSYKALQREIKGEEMCSGSRKLLFVRKAQPYTTWEWAAGLAGPLKPGFCGLRHSTADTLGEGELLS